MADAAPLGDKAKDTLQNAFDVTDDLTDTDERMCEWLMRVDSDKKQLKEALQEPEGSERKKQKVMVAKFMLSQSEDLAAEQLMMSSAATSIKCVTKTFELKVNFKNDEPIIRSLTASLMEILALNGITQVTNKFLDELLGGLRPFADKDAAERLDLDANLKNYVQDCSDFLQGMDATSRSTVFHRAMQLYFQELQATKGKDLSDRKLKKIFVMIELYPGNLFANVRKYLFSHQILSNSSSTTYNFLPEYVLKGKSLQFPDTTNSSFRKRVDLLVREAREESAEYYLFDWKFPGDEHFSTNDARLKMHNYMVLGNMEFGNPSAAAYIVVFYPDNDADEQKVNMTKEQETKSRNQLINLADTTKKKRNSQNEMPKLA